MVYISKVYTKSGDGGQTMLASGDFTGKDDERVDAYGQVDEVNSTIGLVRCELRRLPAPSRELPFLTAIDNHLDRVQQELFDLGAELSEPGAVDGKARLKVTDADITALEQAIDTLNEPLPPLTSFILPGGGPVAVAAHLARTVCRRAERRVVSLHRTSPVRGEAIRYLNRLSDLLFVISRAVCAVLGEDEVLWDQARKS